MENQKEIIGVSKDQMIEVLRGVTSAVPATVTTLTIEKMNKKNNPYLDRVIKKTISNVFINYDYQKAVNNRLVKEGKEADFVAKPRVWGTRVQGTPLVEHNNAFYVSLGYLTKNSPKVEYRMDGEIIDKSVFQEFLPAASKSNTQGLDNDVVVRDVQVENVYELKVAGKIYQRNDI